MDIVARVLQSYGINAADAQVTPFGTGLINHTWKISAGGKSYILQKINDRVFTDPGAIDRNICSIAGYLRQHAPEYLFAAPVPTTDGRTLVNEASLDGGFYRLYPFINGSHSKDVVQDASQAFEAASQFGRFTRLLSGFDAGSLETTLPSFHDLSLRYGQFLDALEKGNVERIEASAELIAFMRLHAGIVSDFRSISVNPAFKKRVTHHDTKISNVLFNENNEAVCVIDLDTVMPGYFISDVGDMMRTYLPTVSEEEKDFSKIQVRDDVYKSIVVGYYAEMEDELSAEEVKYFFYAGKFMIYMQALRFLTDHLNNDVYYGAKYEGHNFVRAGNQAVLLQRLMEKAGSLNMQ
ncbi:aminoglycoside phosphotransferase family protein [Sediminibacterium roseum]|uniref:Aminoglycoside phosphotransferase family protein n=1 Tax=Sediminibacterium roseum TaxID=1978412 RepID=A0ABW9ZT40_9BACT|nr:aminoglycoside phosphotransferase family protein [Sediminibacterium roseum]NCI50294.1 aminoglycoside phosphotransferase family protein [Sediminibacterium roseum]